MAKRPDPKTHILVRDAREHNLRGVDVALPRDHLTVVTGLSGSGKSSLAFDTIYQEGQRRFLESLSSYARQFLGRMEKPNVGKVEGLSPTLAIDQRTVSRNPRSTVGTITEILDHLRLLMARLGTPHCPVCDHPIRSATPSQLADLLLQEAPGAKCVVMGPLVWERKGEYRKELKELVKQGYIRARIDGEIRRLDEPIKLARYEKHTIEVVLDRLKLVPERRERLLEALESGLRFGDGSVTALIEDQHKRYSTERTCPDHDVFIPELEPRLFSFNTPQGACTDCDGLGYREGFDFDLLIDPTQRPSECCLAFKDGRLAFSGIDAAVVNDIVKQLGGAPRRAFNAQPEAVQEGLLYGAPIDYKFKKQSEGRTMELTRRWAGFLPRIAQIYRFTKHKPWRTFRRRTTCLACRGSRIHAIARAVTFRSRSLPDICSDSVTDARAFFDNVELEGTDRTIGAPILRELRHRLAFLDNVGLGYLSIDRAANTLSGGEAQRIRLAAQVGSGLQGVTYVLDEPSIGLHARDHRKLLDALLALRDRGNTVLVVEHDMDTLRAADHLVEIGPDAGREGGTLTAQGAPADFIQQDARTPRWLRGDAFLPTPETRRGGNGLALVLRRARANNLQALDVRFPLGTFTVLTGVSGSGKSTLLFGTLEPALRSHLHNAESTAGAHDHLEGLEHVDKAICIDQSPIGRTPRSNPATYTKLFDGIRELFAKTTEARARGYKKGRFSFNVKGGRCETCHGAGVQRLEMQFLADVEVPCDDCAGRRFNRETLEIRYRGRTITDVLDMPIAEAAEFFKNHRKLKRILDTLLRVGLGYVTLGQPSTTLSGGEAQRIKLARELHRPATGRTVYLLDEPTTGLHPEDVQRLLAALQALVEAGNTVLVIEHNTDVIKVADHLIDLGPDGGANGGLLVGEGTPEHIASLPTPTGKVLKQILGTGRGATSPPSIGRAPKPRPDDIRIRGARRHNLKGIDVDIPTGKMTVITGVSGSGKSSLALHTLFSEGQRRYIESLSTYARRFLGRLDRAPVESIEGLAPAIAIEQRAGSHNPRSTVATVTEIYDHLRLLFARIGRPHCHICARAIFPMDPSRAARWLHSRELGRGRLIAPLPGSADPAALRKELLLDGLQRLWSGEADLRIEDEASLDALREGVALVIDRVDPSRVDADRLSGSVQLAYGYGGGYAVFIPVEGEPIRLSARAECPEHGPVLPEKLTPRHFSFNSHLGACRTCDGLGEARAMNLQALLPHPDRPFLDALDARVGATLKRAAKKKALIKAVAVVLGEDLKAPLSSWSEENLHILIEGFSDNRKIDITWRRRRGRSRAKIEESLQWRGLRGIIEAWQGRREWLYHVGTCPSCRGDRLQAPLLGVQVGEKSISAFCAQSITQAHAFVADLELTERERLIAGQVLTELENRFAFLEDVGLGYITLDRSAHSLSGGESQRIRLAGQLGNRLTDTLYVLDEPTIGLHPRDTDRLLGTLEGLRALGNTVVVVEHDTETIERADYIIDLGPGAGEHGGEVVASGPLDEIRGQTNSLTGRYLSGDLVVPRPTQVRSGGPPLRLERAVGNNLQDLSVAFPSGTLTVITGVSGSGKSTLVMDTLGPALRAHFAGVPSDGLGYESLEVPETLKRVVVVDQSPIGRSPRSTPVTYTKIMGPLRTLYAKLPEAQTRGLTPIYFSFNAKEGRCRSCEGRAAIQIEMHFLSDVWIPCEACEASRYNERVRKVKWKGLSIAEVLELTVDEAIDRFRAHRSILRPLQSLSAVGLGYIKLGQTSTTLSGGEAQRVKLATELQSRKKPTVYLLDEPTTGLHLDDVARLLEVLQRLVEEGHTVLVIEHQLDIIRAADHVIDLGPEGGDAGGTVVVAGAPAEIQKERRSHTGRALR